MNDDEASHSPSLPSVKINKPATGQVLGPILKYFDRMPRKDVVSGLPLDGSSSKFSERASLRGKHIDIDQGVNQLTSIEAADVRQSGPNYKRRHSSKTEEADKKDG